MKKNQSIAFFVISFLLLPLIPVSADTSGCPYNDPWVNYCSIDGNKLISACEAQAMGSKILHSGSCTDADVLKFSNVQVQKLTQDEGTRDFSWSIANANGNALTTTITVSKKSTNEVVSTKIVPPAQSFVSGLESNTAYHYALDAKDTVNGRTAHTEGDFNVGIIPLSVTVTLYHADGSDGNLSQDFNYSVLGISDISTLVTQLTVTNSVTHIPVSSVNQAQRYVSALTPYTDYEYRLDVTDPSSRRTGYATGTFKTGPGQQPVVPTTPISTLANTLSGRILLQVESHGESWYVYPVNHKRYYMANGFSAYTIMRYFGIGITNKNLERMISDKIFAKKQQGKIFLQVESKGEAYYIDTNGGMHYLKNGETAYNVMRELGLGISNQNLGTIPVGMIMTSQ